MPNSRHLSFGSQRFFSRFSYGRSRAETPPPPPPTPHLPPQHRPPDGPTTTLQPAQHPLCTLQEDEAWLGGRVARAGLVVTHELPLAVTVVDVDGLPGRWCDGRRRGPRSACPSRGSWPRAGTPRTPCRPRSACGPTPTSGSGGWSGAP